MHNSPGSLIRAGFRRLLDLVLEPFRYQQDADFSVLCEGYGGTPPPKARAALQFPLAHDAVKRIIPCASNPDEVRQNIAIFETPIPAASGAIARDLYRPGPAVGTTPTLATLPGHSARAMDNPAPLRQFRP